MSEESQADSTYSDHSHLTREQLISNIAHNLAETERELDYITQDLSLLSTRLSETQQLFQSLLREDTTTTATSHIATRDISNNPAHRAKVRREEQARRGREWNIDHILQSRGRDRDPTPPPPLDSKTPGRK
jgi:septal ring factor EnvC (AmiA/AmiB activator)